jgi:hypothetical protein
MPSPFANRHAHAGLQMLTSFFTRMTKEEKKPSIDRSMATSLRRLNLPPYEPRRFVVARRSMHVS